MDIFDAIKQNDIQSVKKIINQDPYVIHRRKNHRKTPLHWACDVGHIDIAKSLIDAGADVHTLDIDGWTPLLWACRYGWTEISQLLIDAGANIRAKDNHGWTPLHYACCNSRKGIVQLLIHCGVDFVDWLMANKDCRTPVDLAIDGQSKNVLVFLESTINQLPDSERKKIKAWRFRQELIKTS